MDAQPCCPTLTGRLSLTLLAGSPVFCLMCLSIGPTGRLLSGLHGLLALLCRRLLLSTLQVHGMPSGLTPPSGQPRAASHSLTSPCAQLPFACGTLLPSLPALGTARQTASARPSGHWLVGLVGLLPLRHTGKKRSALLASRL
jgi:hypothetical protein